MIPVFDNPAELEALAKEKYSLPPFLMMENAAHALANFIKSINPENKKSVHIFCGKGNNGADGLALARLIHKSIKTTIYCPIVPSTLEGQKQYEIITSLGIQISPHFEDFFNFKDSSEETILVDCIYGIGFHGQLPDNIISLFKQLNDLNNCTRIACDVPSGLGSTYAFKADYTLTMGELKTPLFTDDAKNFTGQIILGNLGIPEKSFFSLSTPTSYLLEENDAKAPIRENCMAHKGTYGHSVIFAGEKSGAAILSATAAMNFGSGLTSIFKTENSNLSQFKISPELMICDSIPLKTSAISIGSGLGFSSEKSINTFTNWFENTIKPACVLDADIFSCNTFKQLLCKLNSIENARIVLTPHIKELKIICNTLGIDSSLDRIQIGKKFTQQFQNCTLVMKSAITYIADKETIYICNEGCQNLAKGGSGDVLAGMITSLLAQGYSSKDAAISAVYFHAKASKKLGAQSYNLTPEKLISNL